MDIIQLLGIIVTNLFVAYVAYKLTKQQSKNEYRRLFIERQLSEFYSPILSSYNRSISSINNSKKFLEEAINKTYEVYDTATYNSEQEKELAIVTKEILWKKYHNSREHSIKALNEIIEIFREKYWLAEDQTRKYLNIIDESIQIISMNYVIEKSEKLNKVIEAYTKVENFINDTTEVFNDLRMKLIQ